MSALQELDAALQPMLLLKPPGVSGSKVKEITALCIANIKVRSSRKAPSKPRHIVLTLLPSHSPSPCWSRRSSPTSKKPRALTNLESSTL